jgi:hypothetical protein
MTTCLSHRWLQLWKCHHEAADILGRLSIDRLLQNLITGLSWGLIPSRWLILTPLGFPLFSININIYSVKQFDPFIRCFFQSDPTIFMIPVDTAYLRPHKHRKKTSLGPQVKGRWWSGSDRCRSLFAHIEPWSLTIIPLGIETRWPYRERSDEVSGAQ